MTIERISIFTMFVCILIIGAVIAIKVSNNAWGTSSHKTHVKEKIFFNIHRETKICIAANSGGTGGILSDEQCQRVLDFTTKKVEKE